MISTPSFQNQLIAWKASPQVYAQRTYLATLSDTMAKTRKYVIGTSNAHEVIQLNLEQKLRDDLLGGVNLPPSPKKEEPKK
jgi:hypothetical protein